MIISSPAVSTLSIWDSNTLLGRTFAGNGPLSALAANNSCVGLYNPAASAKFVMLNRAEIIKGAAGNIRIYRTTTNESSSIGTSQTPINGTTAASANMFATQQVGLIAGSTLLGSFAAPANGFCELNGINLIVPAGTGIYFYDVIVNEALEVTCFWAEQ